MQKLLTLDPEIDEPDAHTHLKQIRADLRRDEEARSDPKAYLSGQRNSYKVVADNFESEVRREQSGVIREIAEYKAAWDINVPTIDHETMTTGYVGSWEKRLAWKATSCDDTGQPVKKPPVKCADSSRKTY